MVNPFARLGLDFNPFEPAASGAPFSGATWIPERWKEPLKAFLEEMEQTSGAKAYAILGEYGSGKTYLLRWLESKKLPSRRIRPFYFDNPGVQFYDLANSLLRQIGRYAFAKSLWEFLNPSLKSRQQPLFEFSDRDSFDGWLRSVKRARRTEEAIRVLAENVRTKGITSDEEISFKLGRLIAETLDRPYFEYKDFVAGRPGSLVAEGEEAPYFAALLRALRLTGAAQAVAFLLDEFEEVALQKQLTRRQAHEYLATLKRLISLTEREQFWIIVAMTPQAAEVTERLEPALWDRFISQGRHRFMIPPLNDEEAMSLIGHRLEAARPEGMRERGLFPFPDNLASTLRPDIKDSPRRLVKVCSLAIARATNNPAITVPFDSKYLLSIQEELYPHLSTIEGERV